MQLRNFTLASRVILTILIANLIAIFLKLYLFLLTYSLAILAYLTDTFIDVMNDSIALIALRKAKKPADSDHPYGHGKYEALSRLIISIFVFITVFEIASQSIERILVGKIAVIVESNMLNFFFFFIIYYLSISTIELYFFKKTKIKLLEASLWHYMTDPLTTILVLVSLWLVSKGLFLMDLIASYAICGIIIYAAYKIFKESILILVDQAVLDHEKIRERILAKFSPIIKDCHAIKTRSDGFGVYLECHIITDPNLTVKEAHELAHKVERYIRDTYSDIDFKGLTIHIEPEGGEFVDEMRLEV